MANGQTAHSSFKVTALFSIGIGIFLYDCDIVNMGICSKDSRQR